MAKRLTSGYIRYNGRTIEYRLKQSKNRPVFGVLEMRMGRRKWMMMTTVHMSISGTALRQFARDYLVRIGEIKPRYR